MGHPRIDHASHPRQKGRMRADLAAKGVDAVCGRCSKRVDVLHHDGLPSDERGTLRSNENLAKGPDGTLVHRPLTLLFRCRSKCGAYYPVRDSRLRAATERALEAGAPSVVLGVDV